MEELGLERSVAVICAWSLWWEFVAGTMKKEEGKVKGEVGSQVS